MSDVEIRAERPDHALVAPLLQALDAYLYQQYPVEEFPSDVNHILPVSELLGQDVVFLVAWRAGALDGNIDGAPALGCGATRLMQDSVGEYGEIKRMYVTPAARGQRVGEAILGALESALRTKGVSRAKLETGTRQPEAIRMYQRCGYRVCARFGEYGDNAVSVFMEKSL